MWVASFVYLSCSVCWKKNLAGKPIFFLCAVKTREAKLSPRCFYVRLMLDFNVFINKSKRWIASWTNLSKIVTDCCFCRLSIMADGLRIFLDQIRLWLISTVKNLKNLFCLWWWATRFIGHFPSTISKSCFFWWPANLEFEKCFFFSFFTLPLITNNLLNWCNTFLKPCLFGGHR